MGSDNNNSEHHQRGSIQWFLARASSEQQQQQADPEQRPFKQPRLQPRPQQQQPPCQPHLALRSSNHCQQLLAQQLGWRRPPSLNTWHHVQQQQLSCICLRATPTPTGFRTGAKTSPISCLQIQQLPNSSSSSCSHALVALGDACGRLHICRLSRLQAASAAALNAAAALPADVQEALLDPNRWARRAMAAEGVPPGAGNIPTAAVAAGAGSAGVLSFDTQQQLRSCCWLQQQHNGAAAAAGGAEAVLVSSGPGGLMKWVFTEGRHVTSSLRAKGGSVLDAAGTVVSLDGQAAYQLCGSSGKSLLLWDLRAGPAAAGVLPLQAPPAVLRAMPGGQVLLAADGSGQVCLYDVRRLSNSSIVNFGSIRASPQLLLSHNLRARAQAAGYGDGRGISSSLVAYGVAGNMQFLSDAVLNPVDPTLLAYVTPRMQVGLFDLHSGQLLQQVSLLAQLNPLCRWGTEGMLGAMRLASGGQGCWDSSGRIVHSAGLLQRWSPHTELWGWDGINFEGTDVCSSLAAVDFGSWHGREQRWGSASGSRQDGVATAAAGTAEGQEQQKQEGAIGPAAGAAAAIARAGAGSVDMDDDGSSRQHWWQGQVHLALQGQVLHRELHHSAAPTAVVAAGGCGGQVLVGTRSGDVMLLG